MSRKKKSEDSLLENIEEFFEEAVEEIKETYEEVVETVVEFSKDTTVEICDFYVQFFNGLKAKVLAEDGDEVYIQLEDGSLTKIPKKNLKKK